MLMIIFQIILYAVVTVILFMLTLYAACLYFDVPVVEDCCEQKEPVKDLKNYKVSFGRIKYDTNYHQCVSCKKNTSYLLLDLYQEFGNCGGYSNELFIDCNHCGCKNSVYTAL